MAFVDDTEDNGDKDIVYVTSGGNVLHTRRDCPALEDATAPIREYVIERAPDRPWCANCGEGTPSSSSPHTLHCPMCGALVRSGEGLRVHVRDEHPDE